MFISQLTLTSCFGEPHFAKELFTAVGATQEGDKFSSITGKIGILPTNIDFVNVHQTIFRIFSLGVHVSLQFNEFHLAIIRTVFHCKSIGRANNFTLISSRLNSETC